MKSNKRFHRDGSHVYSAAPGMSHATFTRALRLIMLTVLAVSMVLAVSITVPKAQAESHLPDDPLGKSPVSGISSSSTGYTDSEGNLSWYPIDQLKATWNAGAESDGHYLHKSSVYWTTTKSSYGISQSSGVKKPVLGEMYDFNFNNNIPSYKTRLALSLTWSSVEGEENLWRKTNGASDASVVFYNAAVGVYRGKRPANEQARSNLSVYFWEYHDNGYANDIINPKYPGVAGHDSSTVPIFRVDDGCDTVFMAWRPYPQRFSGSDKPVNAEIAGGAVDPRTGYLYFQTGIDSDPWLDCVWDPTSDLVNNASAAASRCGAVHNQYAGTQFIIWDPATGRYIQSQEIQPRSVDERTNYFLSSTAWKTKREGRPLPTDPYVNPRATGGLVDNRYSRYRPARGFTIDTSGNIHLMVTTTNYYNIYGDGGYGSPTPDNYTETEVVVAPLRDSAGYFINPSLQHGSKITLSQLASSTGSMKAWTYSVARKFSPVQQTTSNGTVSYRAGMGQLQALGYISGHFLTLGTAGLWGANPAADFPDSNGVGTPASSSKDIAPPSPDFYPNMMLCSDQDAESADSNLFGIKLMYSPKANQTIPSDTNSDALKFANDSPGAGPREFGTLTSAQVSDTISGTVRWNMNGSGDLAVGSDGQPVESENNPRLEGEKIALYDKSGRLLETATTDPYGRYSFHSVSTEGAQNYYVRLVQPQVNVGTDGKPQEKQIQDLTSDSILKNRTVYVSTILNKSGKNQAERLSERYVSVDTSSSTSYVNSTRALRNAVQTWARTDGTIERLLADDTHVVAHNNDTSVTAGLSISSTAHCIAGVTAVKSGSVNRYSQCYGAKAAPYVDPSLPTDTGSAPTMKTSEMPIYSTIAITGGDGMTSLDATADFAVTAAGSYGDSQTPPFSTHIFVTGTSSDSNDSGGPFMTGTDPRTLHLGAVKGVYEDGGKRTYQDNYSQNSSSSDVNTYKETGLEHATDDGVSLLHGSFDSVGGDGKIITANNALKLTVSGYAGNKYRVVGWLSDACNSDKSQCASPLHWSYMASTSAVFKSNIRTLGDPGDRKNADGTYTATLVTSDTSFDKTWNLDDKLTSSDTGGIATELTPGLKYMLRVEVVSVDNGSGKDNGIGTLDNLRPSNRSVGATSTSDASVHQYDGPNYGTAEANSYSWTNPGEIEDYRMTINKHTAPVVRLQTQIVDGDSLPADPTFTYQNVNSELGDTRRNTRTKSVTLTRLKQFQPTLSQLKDQEDGALQMTGFHPYGVNDSWTLPIFNMPWGYVNNYNSYDKLTQSSISTTQQPDGVWYDSKASYKVGDATETGLSCYRTYTDSEMAQLGSSVSVAEEPASDADITTAVKKSVLVGTDTEGRLRMTFSPQTVPAGSIVTCLVPYSQLKFELPLTGKAFPWAGVVGLVLLLIGLAGTAIVLVRRR